MHWTPVPKVDLPPVGEEQSSASAADQAQPVEDEPLDFHDLRDAPKAVVDDGEQIAIEEGWREGNEEPDWTDITHKAWCPMFDKRFSRYLLRLLRHDREGPIRKDGGLTFEWLRSHCYKGDKREFPEILLACLNPEKNGMRYQVQFTDDGSILRVRAVQGHTIPGVSAKTLGLP